MKSPKFTFSRLAALTAAMGLAPVQSVSASDAQSFIPGDVQPRCVVDSNSFDAWFKSGQPTANGYVVPADALNFQDNGWCSFYQWSWQNFLWMTSPLDMSVQVAKAPFYMVTDNPDGTRSLVQERVVSVKPRARKPAEVLETGQAGGGGVLLSSVSSLSQESAVVHYAIHVNDTFAVAAEGTAKNAFEPPLTQFPTTADEEDAIANYAKSIGEPLSDPEALMLEVKTSWVDASTLTDKSRYVTVPALIPVYDTSRPGVWIETGTEPGELALLGIHIVGSVKGHPELIWATFEHVDNAPNSDYIYLNGDNEAVESTSFQDGHPLKDYLFFPKSASKLETPVNVEAATLKDNVIISTGSNPIGASITERTSPWGRSDKITDSIHNLHNNTAIIALNKSLMSQLGDGDVRMNYALIGAVWTQGIVPDREGYEFEGSPELANSTMETYHQVGGSSPLECFSCHNVNADTTSDFNYLSHIWQDVLDGFKAEQ